MGSFRVTTFGGIRPREMRGNGPSGRASRAIDVKLWHGSLRPWRYPAMAFPTTENICKMYMTDCCVVTSDKSCANFAELDTNCKIIYSTGHMPWPAYAVLPDCRADCPEGCGCGQIVDPVWCRLGVPAPTNAPTFLNTPVVSPPVSFPSIDYKEQLKREMRAYMYTYINAQGEEGPPSPISTIIDADIASTAILGFSIPPLDTGFCDPVSIRLYRAGSGFNEESRWDQAITEFFFVEDIPFQYGNFTHLEDIPPSDLGETNKSDCHYPPPTNLDNLVATSEGVLIASEGKNVWFSEPWKPHAWACNLNLDDCPKAMVTQDGLLYVATNGHPYVITTKSNEEDCKCCREVNRVTTPAPIFCKRSMVATHNGAMWASDVGLVQMSSGSMQIETHPFMAEDDWQEWFPHEITGVFHKGQYFGFNNTRGFIWDIEDGIYSESYIGDSGKFSELSLTPSAVYSSEQNLLFMAFPGGIHEWDRADTHMPYIWRTELNIDGGLSNYSAMKVVFERHLRLKPSPTPVIMRLYADDRLVFQRNINCSKPFRLPKNYDGLNWQVELTGTESIIEIHLATSMRELVLMNNA